MTTQKPPDRIDDDCPPDPAPPEDALIREIAIVNERGLHARAAARFVQTVENFDADVTVTRCGETVGGTSIMGILMLAAGPGSSIRVTARGPQAAAALEAIEALCASLFGEEE
jgi:phosphocarrier protein